MTRRSVLRGGIGFGLALGAGPLLTACGDPSEDATRLVFFNWQDYVDETLLRDFEEQEGATVSYTTYVSNDELSQRLSQAQRTRRGGREGSSFDLIVPSDNVVTELHDADLLQNLPDDLAGLDNLGEAFRTLSFDPGNRFSVPWAAGTTGIGFSQEAFPDGPPDWPVFLDPAVSGKASVLDETRDAMAVGLFLLGEDPNTEDSDLISRAGEQLAEARANGVVFDSGRYLEQLEAGNTIVAEAYSSDVLQAKLRNPDLEFVVPESGGLRWVDCLCVPEDAPHPDLAFKFIEFYLDPRVSAANAVAIQADTGNKAAEEFLPAEVRDNPAIVPPEDVLARTAFTKVVSDDAADRYRSAFNDAKG